MKETKRILSIILATELCIAMLAGCEQSNNTTGDANLNDVSEDTIVLTDKEDKSVVEMEAPLIEEQGEVITRVEVLNSIYAYAGSPELDFSSVQKYDIITVTDMDQNDAMTRWYAYALGCAGIVADSDGNFTLEADKKADRLFIAQVLLSDLTNRGFTFDKVDESIIPYKDLASVSDSEYYNRNITFLCEEGIIDKSETPNVFDPNVEITDLDIANIIKAYDVELAKYDIAGDVTQCIGTARTVGVLVPIKGDTQVAEANPGNSNENANSTTDTSTTVGTEKTATTTIDQFVAAGFSYTGLNVSCPYTTECYFNTNHTSGTLAFISYTRTNKNDTYDTVTLTVQYAMGDENARTGGISSYYGIEDAYNYTDGQNNIGSLYDNDSLSNFTVTYNGVTYDKCSAKSVINPGRTWIDGVGIESTMDFTITIPKGYDGMVVWISGYPGDDREYTGYKKLSTLDSFYAFKCN